MYISALAGILFASGKFSLGGWLYLFAGACDFIDGRLARRSRRATRSGAALDSVLDRYSESMALVGLGWFYRDSWVLLVVFAALVGSILVPYVRARAEGLGIPLTIGLMQRPERVLLLGLFVGASPLVELVLAPTEPSSLNRLAVTGLILLAVGSHATTMNRLVTLVGRLHANGSSGPPGRTADNLRIRETGGSVAGAIAADLVMFLLLVWVLHVDVRVATALGCLSGGLVNFVLARAWTQSSKPVESDPVGRLVFVSTSSALLNTAGVAVLLSFSELHYLLVWLIVRISVFGTWNYTLWRDRG